MSANSSLEAQRGNHPLESWYVRGVPQTERCTPFFGFPCQKLISLHQSVSPPSTAVYALALLRDPKAAGGRLGRVVSRGMCPWNRRIGVALLFCVVLAHVLSHARLDALNRVRVFPLLVSTGQLGFEGGGGCEWGAREGLCRGDVDFLILFFLFHDLVHTGLHGNSCVYAIVSHATASSVSATGTASSSSSSAPSSAGKKADKVPDEVVKMSTQTRTVGGLDQTGTATHLFPCPRFPLSGH